MSLVIDALVNLWRLFRNAYVRLFGRPPDYVWIEVSGSLPEFESRVGLLQRRLRPGPTGPSLEKIRGQLRRISADGRSRIFSRLRPVGPGLRRRWRNPTRDSNSGREPLTSIQT